MEDSVHEPRPEEPEQEASPESDPNATGFKQAMMVLTAVEQHPATVLGIGILVLLFASGCLQLEKHGLAGPQDPLSKALFGLVGTTLIAISIYVVALRNWRTRFLVSSVLIVGFYVTAIAMQVVVFYPGVQGRGGSRDKHIIRELDYNLGKNVVVARVSEHALEPYKDQNALCVVQKAGSRAAELWNPNIYLSKICPVTSKCTTIAVDCAPAGDQPLTNTLALGDRISCTLYVIPKNVNTSAVSTVQDIRNMGGKNVGRCECPITNVTDAAALHLVYDKLPDTQRQEFRQQAELQVRMQ